MFRYLYILNIQIGIRNLSINDCILEKVTTIIKIATTTLNYTTSTELIKEYFQTHINITVLIIKQNKLASDNSNN